MEDNFRITRVILFKQNISEKRIIKIVSLLTDIVALVELSVRIIGRESEHFCFIKLLYY